MLKWLGLALFLGVIAANIWLDVNRQRRKKIDKTAAATQPRVLCLDGNVFPMYAQYDMAISEMYERGGLLQFHCTITQNGALLHGFCSGDLRPFERKLRQNMRTIFARCGDAGHDGTIKIWYSDLDNTPFADVNDIPLRIIVTFYRSPQMDAETLETLRCCPEPLLRELLTVDWHEVNDVLQCCTEGGHSLTDALRAAADSDGETITAATKNVCRHLCMDMAYFYERQDIYACDASAVAEILQTKYPGIVPDLIQQFASAYVRNTIF